MNLTHSPWSRRVVAGSALALAGLLDRRLACWMTWRGNWAGYIGSVQGDTRIWEKHWDAGNLKAAEVVFKLNDMR